MIRSIGLALALATGSAAAGELGDCFNDEIDSDIRYTSREPDALRITDADIAAMLERIRDHENRAFAHTETESTLLARTGTEKHVTD